MTGLSDTKPIRSQVCLQSLLDSFGFLVGRYYVEETFSGAILSPAISPATDAPSASPAESKDYAEDVIVAIIKSFKTKLPSISFLDDESRAGALEKADAITHKIGYPSYPNTTDADAMERYYAISPTTDSYFGNVVTSRVADLKREWSQVSLAYLYGELELIYERAGQSRTKSCDVGDDSFRGQRLLQSSVLRATTELSLILRQQRQRTRSSSPPEFSPRITSPSTGPNTSRSEPSAASQDTRSHTRSTHPAGNTTRTESSRIGGRIRPWSDLRD